MINEFLFRVAHIDGPDVFLLPVDANNVPDSTKAGIWLLSKLDLKLEELISLTYDIVLKEWIYSARY